MSEADRCFDFVCVLLHRCTQIYLKHDQNAGVSTPSLSMLQQIKTSCWVAALTARMGHLNPSPGLVWALAEFALPEPLQGPGHKQSFGLAVFETPFWVRRETTQGPNISRLTIQFVKRGQAGGFVFLMEPFLTFVLGPFF